MGTELDLVLFRKVEEHTCISSVVGQIYALPSPLHGFMLPQNT